MRGRVDKQRNLFFSIQIEEYVPEDHPLRAIKMRVDRELRRLSSAFSRAYSRIGRPSIPPEVLIKATLIQALFSIRSERQLVEQIGFNMLFRWFLDLKPDDRVFDPTTFTKNRERFAEHGLMQKFFDGIVAQGVVEELMSLEHFSVDGSIIEAYGSTTKSVKPKEEIEDPKSSDGRGDSNGWADFKGKGRSNRTHASATDPEAQLCRKGNGREARLSHSIHVATENRNGLLVDIVVGAANGTAERDAAEAMLRRLVQGPRFDPKTVAADKGYDAGPFLEVVEDDLGVTPHVAIRDGVIRDGRRPGSEARIRARKRRRNKGYQVSQIKRRLTEPVFAWIKDVAGLDRTPFVGRWKTQLYAFAAGAAFNLVRLGRLAST